MGKFIGIKKVEPWFNIIMFYFNRVILCFDNRYYTIIHFFLRDVCGSVGIVVAGAGSILTCVSMPLVCLVPAD